MTLQKMTGLKGNQRNTLQKQRERNQEVKPQGLLIVAIELKVLIEAVRMVKSENLPENTIIITDITIMVITMKEELVQAEGKIKTQMIQDMVTIVIRNRATIAIRDIVTIATIIIVRDIRVGENL